MRVPKPIYRIILRIRYQQINCNSQQTWFIDKVNRAVNTQYRWYKVLKVMLNVTGFSLIFSFR